jgi:hypothetical protein
MKNEIGFELNEIDTSFEVTLENLQAYMAEVCSVVKDNPNGIKNNKILWDRLLKESYGNKPSSTFKFIPCKINADEEDLLTSIDGVCQIFGFIKDGYYYTSMRELLNWGWSIDACIEVVDFTGYRAFKGKAMYKVYQQLRTHSVPAWISHSQRYTESNYGYWYPPEFIQHLKNRTSNIIPKGERAIQKVWDDIVNALPPKELSIFTKDDLGIKRKEIYGLGLDMLEKRVFSFGGYLTNKNDLPHLVNQRFKDPHTQLETRLFTEMLDTLLKEDKNVQ